MKGVRFSLSAVFQTDPALKYTPWPARALSRPLPGQAPSTATMILSGDTWWLPQWVRGVYPKSVLATEFSMLTMLTLSPQIFESTKLRSIDILDADMSRPFVVGGELSTVAVADLQKVE